MLEIKNLSAAVGDKPILKNLSLTVPDGEVMQQLPMEFAVEAQKLIGISLEGSVG